MSSQTEKRFLSEFPPQILRSNLPSRRNSLSFFSMPASIHDDGGSGSDTAGRRINKASQTSTVHERRRRSLHDNPSFGKSLPRQHSLGNDIGRAAAETYLVTRLSITLLKYLGVGYRWMVKFLALACFAMLLMPGLIQVAYLYFFSTQIRRSIVYGDQPRNRLDLYLPKNGNGQKPVVIFVTGGAWIIGYKAWGSLLGFQLAERDIIVACIDYRNFPQGTISNMVNDAIQGISYVCNNVTDCGGDPNRIYLMGQSAGAHISSCALLHQAMKEACEPENVDWSVSQIKAYFGVSGGYNLYNLVDHLHSRGLYRSIFLSIMEGEESFKQFSPEILLQEPNIEKIVDILPRMIIIHGTIDKSLPQDASKTFAAALKRVGAQTELVLFEGKSHTDLILQDPLRGGKDELFEYLVAVVHASDPEGQAKDAMAPLRRRMVPEIFLKLAQLISPF
ncbi:hypothetical protein QQ045_008869 [Rhodiola kirilowii]